MRRRLVSEELTHIMVGIRVRYIIAYRLIWTRICFAHRRHYKFQLQWVGVVCCIGGRNFYARNSVVHRNERTGLAEAEDVLFPEDN